MALFGTAAVVKINGLAVDQASRETGIGTALISTCLQLYFQLGYRLAYGQFSVGSGLETYYRRLGFDVFAPGERASRSASAWLCHRPHTRIRRAVLPALAVTTGDHEQRITQAGVVACRRPRTSRGYREGLGYTLEEAARVLACDRSKVSRIETGQRGVCPADLRVLLPFAGGVGAAAGGPAAVLRFAPPSGLGAVYLDGPSGGVILDSEADVGGYAGMFTRLRAAAVTPQASTRLLRDMAST
jgi:transcriptional regulator with XRE-family HTH domain